MGRKSKRQEGISEIAEEKVEIQCFYCKRDFDDEQNLILHQKRKHFQCPTCHKQCATLGALFVHSQTVHHEELRGAPGASDDRSEFKCEVYGMTGIPDEFSPPESQRAKVSRIHDGTSQTPQPFDVYQSQPPVLMGVHMGIGNWSTYGYASPPQAYGYPPVQAITTAPPTQGYGGYQGKAPLISSALSRPASASAMLLTSHVGRAPPLPPGLPPAVSLSVAASAVLPTDQTYAHSQGLTREYLPVLSDSNGAASASGPRGVSNMPAWMVAQQQKEPAEVVWNSHSIGNATVIGPTEDTPSAGPGLALKGKIRRGLLSVAEDGEEFEEARGMEQGGGRELDGKVRNEPSASPVLERVNEDVKGVQSMDDKAVHASLKQAFDVYSHSASLHPPPPPPPPPPQAAVAAAHPLFGSSTEYVSSRSATRLSYVSNTFGASAENNEADPDAQHLSLSRTAGGVGKLVCVWPDEEYSMEERRTMLLSLY